MGGRPWTTDSDLTPNVGQLESRISRVRRSRTAAGGCFAASGSPTASGRLVGAFRHCGLTQQASRLAADLTAAGLEFAETNPFEAPPRLPIGLLFSSPYVGRLKALCQEMRPVANEIFPASPGVPPADAYLSLGAQLTYSGSS